MKRERIRIHRLFQTSAAVIVLPACLLLASCAGVGYMVGGSVQTFQGRYSIDLTEPHPDIFDLITKVGKSMSLEVSQIDSSKGDIVISTAAATTSEMLVGNQDYHAISIEATDQGRHLAILIGVQGNFGHGTKEAADKLFAEFRTKLLEVAQ